MITIESTGDFSNLEKFLKSASSLKDRALKAMHDGGQRGVKELSLMTPRDTGLTALSWKYEIEQTKTGLSLTFHNENVNDGCNVAIILQYGHSSPNGSWVNGLDYINPSLKPVFEDIERKIWREVTK